MMPLDQTTENYLAAKQGPSLPVPYNPTTTPRGDRSDRKLALNAVLENTRRDVKRVVHQIAKGLPSVRKYFPGKQRRRVIRARILRMKNLEAKEDKKQKQKQKQQKQEVIKNDKTTKVSYTNSLMATERDEESENQTAAHCALGSVDPGSFGTNGCPPPCEDASRASDQARSFLDIDGFENIPLGGIERCSINNSSSPNFHGPIGTAFPSTSTGLRGGASELDSRTSEVSCGCDIDEDGLVMLPAPSTTSIGIDSCDEATEQNTLDFRSLNLSDETRSRSIVRSVSTLAHISKSKLQRNAKRVTCLLGRAYDRASNRHNPGGSHWCDSCSVYVPVGSRRRLESDQVVTMQPANSADNLVDLLASKTPSGTAVSLPCLTCHTTELVMLDSNEPHCLQCYLTSVAKRRGAIMFNDLYCGLKNRINMERMTLLVKTFYPDEYREAECLVESFPGLSETAIALRLAAGIRGTSAKFTWIIDAMIPLSATLAIANGLMPRLCYESGVEIVNTGTCWVTVSGSLDDISICCHFTVPRRLPNTNCLMQVTFPDFRCCRRSPPSLRDVTRDESESEGSRVFINSVVQKINTLQRFIEKRWSWQLLTYLGKHPDMLHLLCLTLEACSVHKARAKSALGIEVDVEVSALQRVCYLVRRDESKWYDKVFRIATSLKSISDIVSCDRHPYFCDADLPAQRLLPSAIINRIVLRARNGVAFSKTGCYTPDMLRDSAAKVILKLTKNIRVNAFSIGCYYPTEQFSSQLPSMMSRKCLGRRLNKMAHILNGNINAALLPYGPLFLENYVRLMTSIIALIAATLKSDVYVTDLAGDFKTAASSSYGMFAYKHALLPREPDHGDEDDDDSDPRVVDTPVYFYDLFRSMDCGDDSHYLSAELLPDRFVTDQYGMYFHYSSEPYFLAPVKTHSLKFSIYNGFTGCLMTLVAKSLIADAMYFSSVTHSRVYITDEHGFFAGRYPMGSADDARVVYERDKLYSVRRIDVDHSIPIKYQGLFLASALTNDHHTVSSVHGFLASHNIHHDTMGWFYCKIVSEENLLEVRRIQQTVNDIAVRLNLTSSVDPKLEIDPIIVKPMEVTTPVSLPTSGTPRPEPTTPDSVLVTRSEEDLLVIENPGVSTPSIDDLNVEATTKDPKAESLLPSSLEPLPSSAPDTADAHVSVSSAGPPAKNVTNVLDSLERMRERVGLANNVVWAAPPVKDDHHTDPYLPQGKFVLKMPEGKFVPGVGNECDDAADIFRTFDRYKNTLTNVLGIDGKLRKRRASESTEYIVAFKMALSSCAADMATLGKQEAADRITGLLPLFRQQNAFISNGTHVLFSGIEPLPDVKRDSVMAGKVDTNLLAEKLASLMREHLYKSLLMNIELNSRDLGRADLSADSDRLNTVTSPLHTGRGVINFDDIIAKINNRELLTHGVRHRYDMFGVGNQSVLEGILRLPIHDTSRFALLREMLPRGREASALKELYPAAMDNDALRVDLDNETPVWMVLNAMVRRIPGFWSFEFRSHKSYVTRINQSVKRIKANPSMLYRMVFPREHTVELVVIACDLESVRDFFAASRHVVRLAEKPSTWHRKSPILLTTDPHNALLGQNVILQLPARGSSVCMHGQEGRRSMVHVAFMDQAVPPSAVRVRSGESFHSELWRVRDRFNERVKDILDLGTV